MMSTGLALRKGDIRSGVGDCVEPFSGTPETGVFIFAMVTCSVLVIVFNFF
jgi:hypothetical protein